MYRQTRKRDCRLGYAGGRDASRRRARPARAPRRNSVAQSSVQFPEPPSRGLPLPVPANDAVYHTYRSDLSQVRALVLQQARKAGLTEGRASDLVLAVSEVAANTLRHTRSSGTLAIWHDDDEVVCEIHDEGIDHRSAGRAGASPARRVRRARALARPPGLRPGGTDLGRERNDSAHAHGAAPARQPRRAEPRRRGRSCGRTSGVDLLTMSVATVESGAANRTR